MKTGFPAAARAAVDDFQSIAELAVDLSTINT
jgi:hypothetical protein